MQYHYTSIITACFLRDEGSWKDIGVSITQYGFVNAQALFLPVMFFLASFYLRSINFTLS